MSASLNSMGKPGAAKLITCLLYQGGGSVLLNALHKRGIDTANLHFARGSVIGDWAESSQEVVTVLVSAEQADEIFAFIFDVAEINRPRGGLLYMENLYRAVPFLLPDVPIESGTST